MKNGIEIRKNGSIILTQRMELLGSFKMYHVYVKHDEEGFVASKNGPWDYLSNARKDADQKGRIPYFFLEEEALNEL